jgi:hypothetical protein
MRKSVGNTHEFSTHMKEVQNSSTRISVCKPKSRKMRWAGHVAGMREMRSAYRILVGKTEGKNHWEDQGVDG